MALASCSKVFRSLHDGESNPKLHIEPTIKSAETRITSPAVALLFEEMYIARACSSSRHSSSQADIWYTIPPPLKIHPHDEGVVGGCDNIEQIPNMFVNKRRMDRLSENRSNWRIVQYPSSSRDIV